jgi:hypothetical protein
MTRKHFEVIAAAFQAQIAAAFNDDEVAGIEKVARELAFVFEGLSPYFDPAKFLKACRVQDV